METPKKKTNAGIFTSLQRRLSQIVRTPRSSTSSPKSPQLSSESTPTFAKKRSVSAANSTRRPSRQLEEDDEWIHSLRESVDESYRIAERELEMRYVAEKQLTQLRRSYLDLAIRFSGLQHRQRVFANPPHIPQVRYRRPFRQDPPPYRSLRARSSTASSYRRVPQPEPDARLFETDL